MKNFLKKSLSFSLVVCLLFAGTSAAFAAENKKPPAQSATVTLDGISYDMDGSHGIDDKSYSITAQYSITGDSAVISIQGLQEIKASLSHVKLTKTESLPNPYFTGDVDEDTSIDMEMTSEGPLFGIVHDEKYYAFGGGEARRARIQAELDTMAASNANADSDAQTNHIKSSERTAVQWIVFVAVCLCTI